MSTNQKLSSRVLGGWRVLRRRGRHVRSVLPPLAVPTQTILILCRTVNPPSPPSATLRTSDHPFLPLRLESDVPSKFGFPISSIFLGSYLSIYIYSRMMAKDEYIRIDSNFPITILDRLLSLQISKQASERGYITYSEPRWGTWGTNQSLRVLETKFRGKWLSICFPFLT